MVSRPLRRPRLAELVADELRNRILEGEVKDGEAFPKQEELLEEFRVSKPALREALAILELEGLLSVRRGNVGGAVVRIPTARDAAYMVGLVLQSQQVHLSDVGVALIQAEAMCAAQAAGRADRKRAVLPRLRQLHQQAAAALGDEPAFNVLARQFHEELVNASGNRTMILNVGLLEALWAPTEHRRRLTSPVVDPAIQRAGLDAHQQIITDIGAGDAEAVMRTVKHHAETRVEFVPGVEHQVVNASALREWTPSSGPDEEGGRFAL